MGDACDRCKGRGVTWDGGPREKPCTKCKGTGRKLLRDQ